MQERNPLEVRVGSTPDARPIESVNLLGQVIAKLEETKSDGIYISRLMQVDRLPVKALLDQELNRVGMDWQTFLERSPEEVAIISGFLEKLLLAKEDSERKLIAAQIVKAL